MIEIERAILATFIYQDLSAIQDTIQALELKDEWFSDSLHKIVAKCLIWLKSEHKGIDENIVLHYISKNNDVDVSKWLMILEANSFGSKSTLSTYIDILKNNTRKSVYEI